MLVCTALYFVDFKQDSLRKTEAIAGISKRKVFISRNTDLKLVGKVRKVTVRQSTIECLRNQESSLEVLKLKIELLYDPPTSEIYTTSEYITRGT